MRPTCWNPAVAAATSASEPTLWACVARFSRTEQSSHNRTNPLTLSLLAQATAVAGSATIGMMESMPPQVNLQGGFGDVVFEATAGTFSGGQTGCGGSRAVVSGGASVTFNPPADGVYTIRAVYASAHGTVSVAAEMAMGAASSGCGSDMNSDGVIDVNDLLGVLSGFGSNGADGSDINSDGVVDVNDLLGVLSDFGGTPSCTSVVDPAVPAVPAPLWCPSSPPQSCRMMCPEAQACPTGQCNMREGSCCASSCQAFVAPTEECSGCCPAGAACFAPDPPCCALRPAVCAMGADCGGQVWNECGTSCPFICGVPPPMMCNAMCNAAYQCPGAMCFNEATGMCQEDNGVLPPDMAAGRPFLNAKLAPETATPYSVVSDWSVEL